MTFLNNSDIEKWYFCVHDGKLNELKKLYALSKEYLNIQSENYTEYDSALHIASARGYIEIVDWLISKGADVNIKDGFYGTPLHYAACEDNLDCVKLLVSKGALINLQNKYYETALHHAAFFEYSQIIEYLLLNGAFRNVEDHHDHTPYEVVKLFDFNRNSEHLKVFIRFRPTLVDLCVETLYHAHTDKTKSFVLTEKQSKVLPTHLKLKLLPYIEIVKEKEITRPVKKRRLK